MSQLGSVKEVHTDLIRLGWSGSLYHHSVVDSWTVNMEDFYCPICTFNQPFCKMVRFVGCGHEICFDCLQAIIHRCITQFIVPTCPFCRRGILHPPINQIDRIAIESLLEQGVLVLPHEMGVTLLHTCKDPDCDQFLVINGHCHCPFILRYMFFGHVDPVLRVIMWTWVSFHQTSPFQDSP